VLLELVEGEPQALRVPHVQLVQRRHRLLAQVRLGGLEQAGDVRQQVAAQVVGRDVRHAVQRQAPVVRLVGQQLLLEQVGRQQHHVRLLRERLRGRQVPDPLVREPGHAHGFDYEEGGPTHVVPKHLKIRQLADRLAFQKIILAFQLLFYF